MLNGRIVLHALCDSSSWGVKKPIKYHGTENNIVGMVEVSNGWVGMTCVCKPCCLFVVYLLIQGLSLVFFATFIPFNLQAVNTFIMKGINKTKQNNNSKKNSHKTCVKLLKSGCWTIHHLPILITKAPFVIIREHENERKKTKTQKREKDDTERS